MDNWLPQSSAGLCGVCAEKTTQRCGGCRSVFYCSKDHQLADWKRHRSSCKKKKCYKVVQEPSKRPYLVATRDIPKGTVILESKPIAIGPSGLKPVCFGCLRPLIYDSMAYTCRGCGWPVCNPDCEQAPMHQPECKAMQEAGFRLDEKELWQDWNLKFRSKPGIWILVLRVLLSNQSEKLLKSHHREDHNRSGLNPVALSMRDTFLTPMGQLFIQNDLKIKQFEPDLIINVAKVILELLFPITTVHDTHSILEKRDGCGVHSSDLSKMSRSCLPNTWNYYTAKKPTILTVVACSNILVGEEICASTSPIIPWCSTLARQSIYFISSLLPCCCKRCMDPTELKLHVGSLSCCKCRGMVTPIDTKNIFGTNWVCDKCWSITTASAHLATWTKLETELAWASKQQNSLAHLVRFIKSHSGPKGILHAKHQLIYQAKENYCNLIYNGSSEKGAAYQFDPKAMETFYIYSKDLNSLNADLNIPEFSFPYFRSILVHCRYLVHKSINGRMTKEEAVVQICAELTKIKAAFHLKPITSMSVDVYFQFSAAELGSHLRRLTMDK